MLDRTAVRYCTGTMIAPKQMLIASSCLTRALRVPGIDCRLNVFAIFPKVQGHSKLTLRCRKVIRSENQFTGDSVLQGGKFAVIELDTTYKKDLSHELLNRVSNIDSRRGLSHYSTYINWKIDKINDYDSILTSSTCRPVYETYANPFPTDSKSPLVSFSDCGFKNGNLGSPITDTRGYIRGIVSSTLDSSVIANLNARKLLAEPMLDVTHISNTYCLNRYTSECKEVKSANELKRLRSEMLSDNSVHDANKRKIKIELEAYIKYFKWNVGFFTQDDGATLETHIEQPRCLYSSASWLNEFRSGRSYKNWATRKIPLKNYQLEIKLSKNLKPISYTTNLADKEYFFSFSPKNVYANGNTRLSIRSTLFGEVISKYFTRVEENCIE